MNETYMLRAQRTQMWHLPLVAGQARGHILCGAPNRGNEERLWLPNQPKPGDALCPKCQQIRREQEKKRAPGEAGEMVTKTD
jgi:hypothetical protein